MWEINNPHQAVSFIYSICLGIIYCAFYDIFRALRTQLKFKDIQVFFQDIIYFIIISFTTFIFFISLTNGEIRGYILLGIFLGFCGFYFTISKYLFNVLKIIFGIMNCLYNKINHVLNLLFDKIGTMISKISKIVVNFLKKVLKKLKGLLYTKKIISGLLKKVGV